MARAAALGRHTAGTGGLGGPGPARRSASARAFGGSHSRGNGTLLRLAAKGLAAGDVAWLEQLHVAPREEEWSEFDADCGKYLAELDKKELLGKYTLAELDEEEQSLDRLRRWCRELRSRDLLGIPATTDSATSLKSCEQRFEAYADHVYAALAHYRQVPRSQRAGCPVRKVRVRDDVQTQGHPGPGL